MEQISRRTLLAALGAVTTTSGLAACSGDEPASETLDPSSTLDTAPGPPASPSPSSSEGSASASADRLQDVDLASPDELRDRWAAYAAMWIAAAVSEGGTGPRAEDGDWIYEMETGQWAYLIRYKDGRAVLAGQSNPDTSRDAAGEKKARAALLAGAPGWWGVVQEVLPKGAPLGFVMGWDGTAWRRLGTASSMGGFDALTFYVASAEAMGQELATWGSEGKKSYAGAAKASADLVMRAGTGVTVAQLKRLGPGMKAARLSAAVRAARAFEGKGKH